MTPAQASGHPNFVVDVPVQGPTDEGMRAAACWWAQHRLPTKSPCVDCCGVIPQWTRNTICPGNRSTSAGIGDGFMETISFGGVGATGFAVGGPSDPDVFNSLDDSQKGWVTSTLAKLNDLIVKSTGTACPTWADPTTNWQQNLRAAANCFQIWWNASRAAPKGAGKPLRTDGIVDEDTLCALQFVQAADPGNFAVVFPDHGRGFCKPPAPVTTTTKKGLSTGAMVGVSLAGAATLGGIIYAASSGGVGTHKRRGRKR
jgi:hypothetical protein